MKRVGLFVLSLLVTGALVAPPAVSAPKETVRGAVVDCTAGTSCVITWDDPSDLTIFYGTAVDAIDRDASGTDAPGNTVTISGLDPSRRYYFELVPQDGASTVVADRSLHLESAPNARDIGGYETKDGHHVKWGTVFRSDALSNVTDADLVKMAGFGIKVVCDFRGPSEVESDGPDKVPAGVEELSLPVFDEDNDIAAELREAITSGDSAAQERLLGNGRAEKILINGGRYLATSGPAKEAFSILLERLTDPASLPTLTHCTAGKDRTGWSTAIILTALGVPKQTVIEDYLLSNEYLTELNEERIQQVSSLMEDPELLRPVLEVRKEYIEESFKAVKKQYGTFAKYLRKGLGISATDLKQLKKNLLTD